MSGFAKRSVSVLLAVLLTLGFMPASAYAAVGDQAAGDAAGDASNQEENLAVDSDSGDASQENASQDDAVNGASNKGDDQAVASDSDSDSPSAGQEGGSPEASSEPETGDQADAANAIAPLSADGNVLEVHGGTTTESALHGQFCDWFGGNPLTEYAYRVAGSEDDWKEVSLLGGEIRLDDGVTYEVAVGKRSGLPWASTLKWTACGSFAVQSYWNVNVSVTGPDEGGVEKLVNGSSTGEVIGNGGTVAVENGGSVQFRVHGVDGYKATSLNLNGYDAAPDSLFGFTGVDGDVTIAVAYEANAAVTYKVDVPNATVSLNGSAVESGSEATANADDDTTIAIAPDSSDGKHYAVEGITVANQTTGETETFAADSIGFSDGVATVEVSKDFYSADDVCTVSADVVECSIALRGDALKVPCSGMSDKTEIEKRIFDALVDGEGSYPELSQQDVVIEYDAGHGAWKSVGYDPGIFGVLGYHAFGQDGNSETIRISYKGNDQYPAMSVETGIELTDPRPVTALTLNDGVSVAYASEDEMKQALFDSLIASLTTADGASVPYGIDDFDFSFTRKVGEQDVTVSYKGADGADGYQPCSATATVMVTKGKASVSVNSQNVTYGDEIEGLVTATPDDCMPIVIMAGVNGDGEGYIGLDFSSITLNDLAGNDLFLIGNQSLQEFFTGILGDEFSLNQLKGALDGLQSLGISDSTGIIDGLNRAFDLIESISPSLLDAKVHFGMDPEDAGLYTVVAVTASPNYDTAFGVGYVTIKPQSQDVSLSFTHEVENGLISADDVSSFDFGVTAVDGQGNPIDPDTVRIFYTGVTTEGDLYYGADAPTQPGAYVQSAMILGGNYFAAPISRAYVIGRYSTATALDGFEGNARSVAYTGDPVQLGATVTLANGEVVENPQIDWLFFGYTNGGKLYASSSAPTEAGRYAVTAFYEGDATKGVSMDSGTLTIERGDIAVTPAANDWTYDGSPKEFEFASSPDGLDGFTVEYRADSAEDWSTEAPVDAGKYEVRVTRAQDANLNAYEAVFPFTVEKAVEPDIVEGEVTFEPSSDGLTVTFPDPTLVYEWDDNPEFSSPEEVRGGVSTFSAPSDPGAPFFVIDQPGTYYFRVKGDIDHKPSLHAFSVTAARVTFDANGEGAVIDGNGSWMLRGGSSMGADLPSASRSGYTFEGWRTADGAVFDETTPVNGDITVYAAWSADAAEPPAGGSGDQTTEPNDPQDPADPQDPTDTQDPTGPQDPAEPTNPSPVDQEGDASTGNASAEGSASAIPATGDSPIAFAVAGGCVAVAAIALCVARMRMRRRG